MKQPYTEKQQTEVLQTLQVIANTAEKKKFKNWETCVETYEGLQDYLISHGYLTERQGEIVKRGCQYNKMPCPDVIDPQEIDPFEDILFAAREAAEEQEKAAKPSISKEDLDTLLTQIALSFSDHLYKTLND